MKNFRFKLTSLTATLGCALALAAPASASAAASINVDPFARPAARTPSPFHTAQAEAAPDSEPRTKASEQPAAKETPAATRVASEPPAPPVAPPATPTASTPAATGQACVRDDQCPTNTICESGTCRPFERAVDILLYRKEGGSTAFIPFYFSNRGNPGHRVVAPLYFHFWSAESHTQIVAPFYWRVEDYLKQRVVRVVGLYSSTSQPDAKSWAFWPVFYVSTKFGWAVPPLLSFKVGDPDHGKGFGMWLLLYYWSRSPEHKFDLLFPFAISTRSKQSAFTYAVPLNFYWRTGDDKNLLSLPFFYQNKTPTGGTFASPLGYSSVEHASNYDVLFPLLWSFRSPGASTTIVPPLFHFRSKGTATGTFAFFAWWSSDEKAKSNWQLVLPLYFRTSNGDGARTFHLWPTGTYQRNDKEGSRYLSMLVPPMLYWRDKTDSIDYELLYYRHHDIPADAHTTIIGPYYHRNDPQGSTTSLFPLFWHFRDAGTGATAHALLPFYFRRNAPNETLTAAGFFPLWFYYRSFADGGKSGGLFPLAFFGSRKNRSHTIVFPLFWRFRNADSAATLLFPLFYRSSDKLGDKTILFPLLYASAHDDRGGYRFQFPFYWNVFDHRDHTETTVTPLFFRHADPKGYAAGIVPLFFWGGGERRHFALFPIFWWFRDDAQDRTTTVVGPYWHRTVGGETTDALFPLFHYRRGARPGGNDETSLTLFPIFHYRRDAQTTVFASPVAAWLHRSDKQVGFAGPYFWYRSATVSAGVVPLLYLDHTQLDTGERTRMWGPVIATDGPGHQARVVLPFWAHYKNARESGTYAFPTYFRLRRNDGYRLDTFFPLVWLSQSPTTHTTVLGPYFTHRSPQRTSAGLLPFYYRESTDTRDLFITPLFAHSKNHKEGSERTLAWLYYQSAQGPNLLRTVLPLFYQWRDKDTSNTVGFPLYWHFANQREHTSTTVAGPLFWTTSGSERTRGLLSAWYSRDAEKHTGSNALLPLFYARHTPDSRTLLTLPFGFRSAKTSLWWYAGPLAVYHHNYVTDTHTRVIPPLLHYSSSNPEQSLSTWLLLFWHRSNITSSMTIGLPLFYDFHSYHQSRFSMVLPLFFHYRNEDAGTSTTVAPLFFRHASPTDSTTVAFPLLWRFWSPDRATTIVFPFYFNVRRPTADTTYVFPNVYYRKGLGSEAGTSHLFVFPFWESEVKRPGDSMWEALLGVVGWERIGRNRFLKLLFIPFQLEPAPAAKTAWYGKPPAHSRERVARGLDVRSW
jgi:hypothetical protein